MREKIQQLGGFLAGMGVFYLLFAGLLIALRL